MVLVLMTLVVTMIRMASHSLKQQWLLAWTYLYQTHTLTEGHRHKPNWQNRLDEETDNEKPMNKTLHIELLGIRSL